MLDFTWKVFSMTGDIDTYLLLKELEKDDEESDIQEMMDLKEEHPLQ